MATETARSSRIPKLAGHSPSIASPTALERRLRRNGELTTRPTSAAPPDPAGAVRRLEVECRRVWVSAAHVSPFGLPAPQTKRRVPRRRSSPREARPDRSGSPCSTEQGCSHTCHRPPHVLAVLAVLLGDTWMIAGIAVGFGLGRADVVATLPTLGIDLWAPRSSVSGCGRLRVVSRDRARDPAPARRADSRWDARRCSATPSACGALRSGGWRSVEVLECFGGRDDVGVPVRCGGRLRVGEEGSAFSASPGARPAGVVGGMGR